MGARWTEEEDTLVRDYYTLKGGQRKLVKLLPHRSLSSIKSRAHTLGCTRWSYRKVPPGREGTRSARFLYGNYRRGAEKRGHVFELSRTEFDALIVRPCHYCGEIGGNRHSLLDMDLIYNGIDRVDNERGYVAGNVVPCCGLCNRAKHATGQDEFLTWVSRVYHHAIVQGKAKKQVERPALPLFD